MSIQVVKHFEELEVLRNDWDAMSAYPTTSFDWMKAWWLAFGQGHELQTLVIRNPDNEVVGIVPFYLSHAYGIRTLKLLGSGKACSDYLQVLCRIGYESTVQQHMDEYLTELQNRYRLMSILRGLKFEGIVAESSSFQPIIDLCQTRGMHLWTKQLESCWQVHLPGTWDEQISVLNSSFRRKVRKCLERIDQGEVTITVAQNADDWQHAYTILERLHQARRHSIDGDGCFNNPRFCDFIRRAIPAMFASQKMQIAWLTANDRPIAVTMLLKGPSYMGLYQAGLDPEARHFEPGHSLAAYFVRDSIQRGLAIFDFMRGNEPYKQFWRSKEVELVSTLVVPSTLGARCLFQIEQSARELYRQAKRFKERKQASPMSQPETAQATS